jgi:hypothetical protein
MTTPWDGVTAGFRQPQQQLRSVRHAVLGPTLVGVWRGGFAEVLVLGVVERAERSGGGTSVAGS